MNQSQLEHGWVVVREIGIELETLIQSLVQASQAVSAQMEQLVKDPSNSEIHRALAHDMRAIDVWKTRLNTLTNRMRVEAIDALKQVGGLEWKK